MASPATFPKKGAPKKTRKNFTQNKGRYFESNETKVKKNKFKKSVRKGVEISNKFKNFHNKKTVFGDEEEGIDELEAAKPFEVYESTSESDEIQEVPTVNSSTPSKKKKVKPVKQRVESFLKNVEVEEEVLSKTAKNVQMDIEEGESGDEPTEEAVDDTYANDEEVKAFKEQINTLPLGKIRELQERLGLKLFEKLYAAANGGNVEEPKSKKNKLSSDDKSTKKEKKKQHHPREISSKKPVSSLRNIFKNEKLEKKKWDPRFDARAGTLKEHCFDTNYEFLNEIRANEQEALKNELAVAKENGDEPTIDRITNALRKMEDQERSRKEKQLKKTVMDEVRQENIDRMMSGQAPRYLPKGELRRKVVEKKYDQLKSENGLDRYLKRKAKKQGEKEKKKKFTAFKKSSFESQYGYQ